MKSETTSVTRFKSELSKYLAKARSGRIIEVTSHRKVIARVVGVPDKLPRGFPAGLAEMAAHGKITLGNGEVRSFKRPIKLSEGGPTLSEIVLEDRGPR
jgi:antitoxin (DNA-binding transcriptional repressor) of toxin-antitoxin stability system